MQRINRRDFLKLTGTVSASFALQSLLSSELAKGLNNDSQMHNVLIIVFDTMSARNMSLYSYPRRTTPNLERFADRATVYHSHWSAGNYTVPGTASLLTGTYPWTHRAINQSGLIARQYESRNIYNQFGSKYHRFAFSQNIWANFFLNQFDNDIDVHLPPSSYSIAAFVKGEKFPKDYNSAYRALDDSLVTVMDTPSSLIFGIANRLAFIRELDHAQGSDYPRGLPGLVGYPVNYRLSTVYNGVISECRKLASPFLTYFHLFSPHEPYRPHADFIGAFDDDLEFVSKPMHSYGYQEPQGALDYLRREYDENILNVDFEFGRLLDTLEENGLLDNSYVIVTSDHGQLFERGVHGHTTALMHEPIITVPLVISSPGQKNRRDVYTPSSNVDLLPTLLYKNNLTIPAWCEGQVLPEVDDQAGAQRSIFSLEAKINPSHAPINIATIAMRKGPFKLTRYFGYPGYEELYEMYDIESDPEELKELTQARPPEFALMKDEMLVRLAEVNRPYEEDG